MSVADLGLRIDSSQAKGAKADLDAFSAASGKAEAAAEKLGRASAKANADMAKISAAVTQANSSLDKLVAEAGQSNASFQKLIATVEQTNAAIEKLGRGAPKLPNPKPFNDNLGQTNKLGKQTTQMFLNLSRQGNDVATMFLLGASAQQVFFSQTGQVIDALQSGPGGLRGSLELIRSSLLSLITRFPLVTAGIGAAGAAFVAYKALGGSQIRSLDEILKEHEANIRRLGDAYDEANEKRKKYASLGSQAVNALNEGPAKETRNLLARQINDIFSEVYKQIGAGGGNQGALQRVLKSQFEPFSAALDDLAKEAKKANPDIVSIGEKIANIAKTDPANLNKTRDILLGLLKVAGDTAAELPNTSQKVTDLTDIVNEFNLKIAAVDSGPLHKALQDIFDKAKDGKEPLDTILLDIAKLEAANPSFAGIIEGLKGIIVQAVGASNALAQAYAAVGGSPNGRRYDNGRGTPNPYELNLPATAPTPEARPSVEDFYARRDKALAKAARAPNPYRDILKNADDRIKQMQTELDLMGKVGVEADSLRNYQDLLAKATDRGRTVGEKQKQELHDRAEAMAKLEDATKKAKLTQDLLFDRAQMFRSPIDQTIAETMRSAGLEVDFESPIAGMIRFNEQLKQAKDYADDFASTFVDGIMNGENALDALGDAASSVLSDIAKELIQMAMNQMINSLLQGLIGAFGGGFTANTSLTSYLTGDPWAGLRVASAKGNVFSGPGISAYSNQIVTKPTIFPFAKGMGLMGEAGAEGILPLRRNSQGQLGVMSSGQGGALKVEVNNYGEPADATVSQRTDADGTRVLEVMMEKKIQDEVTRPSAQTNRNLRGMYGLSNQVVRR
ncbi:phage tail length tape measure family protein [Mesorhizobium sp. CN5-321]|uniref:phage tail length tape measure family protein n=1 Tax=Mesorhizobium hunchu TaxID=3157708 RepID=UPI0032B860E7